MRFVRAGSSRPRPAQDIAANPFGCFAARASKGALEIFHMTRNFVNKSSLIGGGRALHAGGTAKAGEPLLHTS